jgi:hypothetical protein
MTENTDTRRPGQTLKASELRIGDIVTLSGDNALATFNQIIVRNIRVDERYPKSGPQVYLSRPYALLGDWITTGGVGVSLATEEFSVAADHGSLTFTLVKPTDAERHARAVQKERDEQQAELKRLREHAERLTAKVTSREAYAVEQEQKRMHLEAQLVVTETARKAAEARVAQLDGEQTALDDQIVVLQTLAGKTLATLEKTEAALNDARYNAAQYATEAEQIDAARKAAEAELVKLRTRINFFAQEVAQ